MPAAPRSDALFQRLEPRREWNAEWAGQLLQWRFNRPCQPRDLLQAMIVLQHHFGAIGTAQQTWLARQFDTDCANIRALIHFYHLLEEEQTAPLHLRFSSNIIEQFQDMETLQQLLHGEARQHLHISTTSCIGLGDQGPAALINGFPLTRLNAGRIRDIAHHLHKGVPLQEWPDSWFQVDTQIRQAGPLLQFFPEPGSFLTRIRALPPEQILDSIQRAGLRGAGGAGFPAGTKWQHCAATPAEQRYVICNADEGEPGTFKDRVLLQHNPDALLCGLALCAHAIGARQGFIYLRGEYLFLWHPLQQRLGEWRRQGWLNDQFDIEIQLGAGAYVCGEETALLESMEGKRGIPRIRPPFPVQQGLYQQPTVVNNVETLVAAAWIAEQGVDAFRQLGTPASPGSHLHSVSGDCDRPGIYELAYGSSIADLLQQCGARQPALVQLGGASGTLITPAQFQQALAFESVSSGGSIMIFDQSRSLLDITRNFTAFFQHESCGFCTPCRAGCQVLHRELQRHPSEQDHAALRQLAHLINDTSHCGLGHSAGHPVLKWLEHDYG